MNATRTTKIAPVLLATVIVVGLAVPVAADSAAELLEKGIYTEQTVGDLTAAIEIYKQLVEDAEANRPHLAQAQLRLGMCYLKMGNEAEARAALDKLIREFPEQEQLVARAREQLAAAQPALALGPVPWEDGESLRYNITLSTGKVIGSMYLGAESTEVDGIEAWQLELRRVVLTNADNFGVSRVWVDGHTQRPIRSTVRHGLLGDADTNYGPDGAEVTSEASDTQVDSDREIYDNEQILQLMRMLPLEPGYKTKISFLTTWTAEVTETGLEVTGKETCQVPAGDFECVAVVLDVGQTNWYSTGPERYPVKLKAGGVLIELAEIGRTDPGATVAFALEEFGFSGMLPAGWLSHEQPSAGRADKGMVRLLDPNAEAISAIELARCPQDGCPPMLKQMAERELAGARERFEAYELREGSWTERTIAGHPAISFVGDYKRGGKPWVQYRLYTLTDELRLEVIFRTPVDRFEELRPAFDSVAENLDAE